MSSMQCYSPDRYMSDVGVKRALETTRLSFHRDGSMSQLVFLEYNCLSCREIDAETSERGSYVAGDRWHDSFAGACGSGNAGEVVSAGIRMMHGVAV